MRLSRELAAEVRQFLDKVIDDADADIVYAIRQNNGQHGSREALLSQLDVLETVRERLNVRFNRINEQ